MSTPASMNGIGPDHARAIRIARTLQPFDHNPQARPADPARWWRTLCWAADRIAVSGDLDPARAADQLAEWVAAGVTDVLDVRGEANDARRVAAHAPTLRYHWLGTHDDGDRQASSWFDEIATVVDRVLADPDRRLIVHCHLGVNRGPSATLAALLLQGLHPIEAMDAIRAARPVASMMYAGDAVVWWGVREGLAGDEIVALHDEVCAWHEANPLDVPWCIEQMGRSRFAA